MPGWQAVFPEVVDRADASAALSLAAAATNVARGVAPALAGGLLAWCGARVVFTLDAVLLAITMLLLAGWRRPPQPQGLPTERFVGAMKAALRYVFHAPAIEAVLARNVAFVLCAIAPVALLPILVRTELALPAASFGALMTAFGGGGVLISVFVLPKICSRYSIDRVLMLVTLLAAGATLALAWTRNTVALGAALFVLGGAWMAALASLNIAAQLAVPDWVRGRASSVNLFLVQGTVAVGSLLAGLAAQQWGLHVTLELAAGCLIASLALGWLLPLPQLARINLTASHHWPAFDLVTNLRPDDGPVLVSVDYRIAASTSTEFKAAIAALRLIRLRDGGLRWDLLEDLNEPGHYQESFLVESWSEHLRQVERATVDDQQVERAVRAFHIAAEPPALRHFLVTKPIKLPRGRRRRG
jgi:predicted MFS family arabinose efflux permease